MQSEPTEKVLSPKLLSSTSRYFFWAILYSALHLFFYYHLFLSHGPYNSTTRTLLLLGVLLGPCFYFNDLYLRQIWWPYRTEMLRWGGIPAPRTRIHPYDLKRKTLGLPLMAPGMSAVLVAIQIPGNESFSHTRNFWLFLPTIFLLAPAFCFGIYYSCFHVRDDNRLRNF